MPLQLLLLHVDKYIQWGVPIREKIGVMQICIRCPYGLKVEVLTRKSQFLATELERKSNQLNEATALFQVEPEKNNAATASIKYLTSQLKDMAARVSQGASCRAFGPVGDTMWAN